jgi:hypothetical protein
VCFFILKKRVGRGLSSQKRRVQCERPLMNVDRDVVIHTGWYILQIIFYFLLLSRRVRSEPIKKPRFSKKSCDLFMKLLPEIN